MTDKITHLTLKNMPAGNLRIQRGLRYRSNGNSTGKWQLRYTINGKEKTLALGDFPAMGLKDAREAQTERSAEILRGNDPRADVVAKAKVSDEATITFGELAKMAFADHRKSLKEGGKAGRWWSIMETHVLPELGAKAVSEISGRVVANAFRDKWDNMHPTATKCLDRVSVVLRWAAAAEYPADEVAVTRARVILGKSDHKVRHHKTMDWQALPQFFAGLDDSMQNLGLKFFLLTLTRPSNAAGASWEQIDGPVWRLTAEDMKTPHPHHVPLTAPALAILDEASKHYDGRSGFVFKNPQSWKTGRISINNWCQQMRRSDLASTSHGMRTAFKRWATFNRMEDREIVEEVLAHRVRSAVEMAYLGSEETFVMDELAELRRAVMTKWATFITSESNFGSLPSEKPQLRLIS